MINTSPVSPTHNLPRQLTALVGRATELAQIRQQLLDPACHLLTLLGPGGMGKTSLAIEAARGLQAEFAAGVHFVNLQPLNDVAQLPAALADALAFPLSGSDPVESQLLRYLANKELLLLLDNFEHLLGGAEFLSEVLAHAPAVKALVTSREVLNLQEEWLFPLAGLTFPPPGFDPQTIEQYSAANLFLERMRRLRPQLALTAEAAAIGRICQLVEGMPLALELAASWTKSLACAEIATEIARSISFLTTSLRNTPERHRNMLAVFATSWALLEPAEQEIFRRLSVFRSSFTAEAAERIVGASRSELVSLVDKSLLRWERVDVVSGWGHSRYRLHELLRQFAAEKLAQTPQTAHEVQARHCAYFTDFLAQRQVAVIGAEQAATLAAIEAEIDNLRAAWDWALHWKLTDAITTMLGVMLIYNQMRSRYREGVMATERAIQALSTDSISQVEKTTLLLPLVSLGWLRIRLGEFEAAEQALRRCQLLYQELELPPQPGYGSDPETALSLILAMRGNLAEALALAEESHQRNMQHAHALNLQFTHYVLCGIKLQLGQYAEARHHAQAALAMSEANGDRWFMATCLLELGQVEEALGHDDAAQHHFQTSYTLRTALADRGGMAVALNHLGRVALRQQNFAHAQELYEQSRQICVETNDRGGLATALEGLGVAATARGDFAAARQHFAAALDLAGQIQLVSLIFSLFLQIGKLFQRAQQEAHGLALLTLVRDHPASPSTIRQQAAHQLAHDPAISPINLAASASRWRTSESIATVAAALLAELAHLPGDLSSPPLAQPVIAAQPTPAAEQALVEPLTERELEILRLLAQGLTNDELAHRLVVAVGTIKSHNHSIFSKLGVNNRTSAINRARQLRLL